MTSTTSWAAGVSGDWNTAANWTNGVPVDQALITASGTYTVTSSAANSVHLLAIAKKATLAIAADELDLTGGTLSGGLAGTITVAVGATFGLGTVAGIETFENAGAIDLQSNLMIEGSATLDGKGEIDLSGNAQILPNGGAATLTNVDNAISGAGTIGNPSLTLVNEAKGVINATGNLVIDSSADSTNAGLMEAKVGNLILGNGSTLTGIDQSSKGRIEAAGGEILLESFQIGGGQVSIGKGAFLDASGGDNEISTSKPIKNAGVMEIGGGLTTGAIKNTSTGVLAVGGIAFINDAVTGGTLEIQSAADVEMKGALSANVTFDAGSTGLLALYDPTQFKGTVSGLGGGGSIDLENISFADGPVLDLNAKKTVLTVTDPVTDVVDRIKLVYTGFIIVAEKAPDGSTLIVDPPANPQTAPGQSARLLAQSMATFGAATGIAGSVHADAAGHPMWSGSLASNSQHWHK